MKQAFAPKALNQADGSVNQVSLPFNICSMSGYSVQAVLTGSLAGTIKLQSSNDDGGTQVASDAVITNWTDIDGSSQTVAAGTPTTWNASGAYYRWVRAVYTATSGTGTVTISFNAKGTV